MSIADEILSKAVLPTSLSSREIRAEIAEALRRRSVFSARVTSAEYLQQLREKLAKAAAGKMSPESVRIMLQAALRDMGYTPEGGFPDDDDAVPPAEAGTLRDISSAARIKLQVDTAQRQGASLKLKAMGFNGAALYTHPGWRFTRRQGRKTAREWGVRWYHAGNAVGWEGAAKTEMVALKDSPIWEALGEGEGGSESAYTDTLGTDFPPFAFNSGMEWERADRATCIRLGLIDGDYDPKPLRVRPGELAGLSEAEVDSATGRLTPEFRAAILKEMEDW